MNRRRSSVAGGLGLAGLVLALGGCLSLGDDTPVAVYAPQPPVTTTKGDKLAWSLLIATPVASEVLDSARIAVRPEPGRLQVYKGAAWPEPLPQWLQAAVIRGFEDSGRIVAAGRPGSGLHGERALLIEIRHFEAEYRAPKTAPVVVLEVQATLLANPSGAVLASRRLRQEEVAAGEAVPAVNAAFETASGRLLSELVDWTLGVPAPSND